MSRPPYISQPDIGQNNEIDTSDPVVSIDVEGNILDGSMTPYLTEAYIYNDEYGNFTIPTQPPLGAVLVAVDGNGDFSEAMDIYVGEDEENPEPNLLVIWAMWDFPDIEHPETWYEISWHAFEAWGNMNLTAAKAVAPTKIQPTHQPFPSKRLFAFTQPLKPVDVPSSSPKLEVAGSIRVFKNHRNRDNNVYLRVYPASALTSSPKLLTPWEEEAPPITVTPNLADGKWGTSVDLPFKSQGETEFLIVGWIQSPGGGNGYGMLTNKVTVRWV